MNIQNIKSNMPLHLMKKPKIPLFHLNILTLINMNKDRLTMVIIMKRERGKKGIRMMKINRMNMNKIKKMMINKMMTMKTLLINNNTCN